MQQQIIAADAADMAAATPESLRMWAVRQFAALDVANGTDSTGHVVEMARRFPAGASSYLDTYAAATRYARAVAAGVWPVTP